LLWGVAQLGDETGHAWSGGLIALASGLVLGWLGQLGERRLTTWLGGALASIGALIIAVDAATSDNAAISGDFDGVGPGIVVMLFGVAFVALAVLLAGATRRGPGGTTPPFVGATPGPAPAPADAPNAPAPWAAPPSEPPSTSQWARPPTVEVDDSPPATDPS
jgi:drug/metabolite transporter (DMT)-like permease